MSKFHVVVRQKIMIYIEYYPLKIAKELITTPQMYCTQCRSNYETGFLFSVKYPHGQKIICIRCLGSVMKTLLLRFQHYNPVHEQKKPCTCLTCNQEHGLADLPQTYVEQMKQRHENVRKGEY